MPKPGSFHRVSSSSCFLHELAHETHETAAAATTGAATLALHVHLEGHLGGRGNRILL
jgi:hypothetical protein